MSIAGCQVMAKPGGSLCNLNCTYCFYLEKAALYPDRHSNWRMTDTTLEHFIRQYIAAQKSERVSFSWQGGEPTLMGLPFFRRVVELCQKYAKGKTIEHALQTNGILLNEEWASFFAQHHFILGLSVDGPANLHNSCRVNRAGKETHRQVMTAMGLLKAHNVEFNTLTVVGNHNVGHAREVYEFLIAAGSRYIQFIPLVERINAEAVGGLTLAMPGESPARLAPWTVPPLQYGKFLQQIFDIWVRRDTEQIGVQMFDVALAAWTGQPPVLCVHAETCGHAFALEANGDLYQCDHYVYPHYLLGNIHRHTIDEMNNSEQAAAFARAKRDGLTADCRRCDFRFVCHGGCPKHRFALSPSGHPGHNYLCAGYYSFFKHITRYMNVMQELQASGYPPSLIAAFLAQKEKRSKIPGRNASCFCGSGKKSKNCCQR